MYDQGYLCGNNQIMNCLPPINPCSNEAKQMLDAKNGAFLTELGHFLDLDFWYVLFR